jgi:hypothetical protein
MWYQERSQPAQPQLSLALPLMGPQPVEQGSGHELALVASLQANLQPGARQPRRNYDEQILRGRGDN